MKILHISNHSVDRCGVALFGRQCSAALRAEGVEVDDWDATYSPLHAREERGEPSYLPASLAAYDVVHLNWQPSTINHYHPVMFPLGQLYSVFLHDLPPWSSCPFEERMQVKFALEPYPGAVEIPPPAPDFCPFVQMCPQVTIGRTNIREAGKHELGTICFKHDWIFNDSNPHHWLSEEEEVERLARSWVNVVWYDEHRSRGSAAMVAAAARRPLLLSYSERFSHLLPYQAEFYQATLGQLESTLLWVIDEVRRGQARVPSFIPEVFGWRRAARTMIKTWEAARV